MDEERNKKYHVNLCSIFDCG